MSKTLRVGMIGYRFMGKAHSNAWRQAPHFFPLAAPIELRTICGRDAAALEAARIQFGWQNSSTDWRTVVNSSAIDIIDINKPNDSHAKIAAPATHAGNHDFCEKWLALPPRQYENRLGAVKNTKAVAKMCNNHRRLRATSEANKMFASGTIGKIYHYYGPYAQDRTVNPDLPPVGRSQKAGATSDTKRENDMHVDDQRWNFIRKFQEFSALMHRYINGHRLRELHALWKKKYEFKLN